VSPAIYGTTQCYLPPDTSERAPPQLKPEKLVFNLHTLEAWNFRRQVTVCDFVRL